METWARSHVREAPPPQLRFPGDPRQRSILQVRGAGGAHVAGTPHRSRATPAAVFLFNPRAGYFRKEFEATRYKKGPHATELKRRMSVPRGQSHTSRSLVPRRGPARPAHLLKGALCGGALEQSACFSQFAYKIVFCQT